MKKILLSSMFSILSLMSIAQIELSMADIRTDWKLIKQESGVEVYLSSLECTMGNVKKPFIYGSLKVINTLSEQTNISFTYELHYMDGCSGCDASDEYSKFITVEGNSMSTGDCAFINPENTILLVNPLQTEKVELNKLVINDFKIK